jgi:holliday junction DNA helicase RuvA
MGVVMIGFLRGIIVDKLPPVLVLDVNGVGYEIQAPMSTFYHLPDLQQSVSLLTHLIVREDAHLLYGFYQSQERDLFRALIKVNGVGPKLALSILSGITIQEFVQCVQDNDVTRLVHIPGIGKKTAERLVIETRDTLLRWNSSDFTPAAIPSEQRYIQDAISALTALGYKPNEAQRAIKQVQQPGRSSEELIRLALQNMATI